MAKIPSLSLSRYYSSLRSQPGKNWEALAHQDTERKINEIIGQVNQMPTVTELSAKSITLNVNGKTLKIPLMGE